MPAEMRTSEVGEPTWEIAMLFPRQGAWSELEYLTLDAGRLVEFDSGKVELVPMPTELHQAIVLFLYMEIQRYLALPHARPGVALVAPLRMRTGETKYREPDVLFMLDENRDRRTSRYWTGADVVVEIVSGDDPDRDCVTKRQEYASAGIPEYWIVDPRDRTICVLTLNEGDANYSEAGRYSDDRLAASIVLPGFEIDVSQAFDRPEVA